MEAQLRALLEEQLEIQHQRISELRLEQQQMFERMMSMLQKEISSECTSSSRDFPYIQLPPALVYHSSVGTMFYSVAAASSLGQDVPATKPSQSHKFKDVVLYQYEACPFYYYDIPYKVVEVNSICKEINWSDYKKVPILTANGQQLFKGMHPDIRTDSMMNTEEEKKWLRGYLELKCSSQLVWERPLKLSMISQPTALTSLAQHAGNFSFVERAVAKYRGAAAMYFKHEITDERAALYQAAETRVDALQSHNFLVGSKPNLADLTVFGVLRPTHYL
ncbi:hypothetical protein Cgig2_034127 [Carnegiea gigantea]|uniref:Uncharacterized protein n=1 Tax=Carnegiea gigantea TaxID=171969 RepID=A0A9Q1QGR6_9CARY|nr:hypothetical protein Cgig2_034127 [Carnegiea gigantea]